MRWVSDITFDVYVLAALVFVVTLWVPMFWPWVPALSVLVMGAAILVQVLWGEL
jgi:hypothetical protein